jgi:hypothetical protein
LARLARKQYGVVSRLQLGGLGYSDGAIKHAIKVGRLHPVQHEIYAVGHANLSRQGHAFAAVLACGDGTLLSHRSAAWLWGLTKRWQPTIEVTAATPRRARRSIRVHSAEALTPDDVNENEGIPVTAMPRTLLDFAAVDPLFLGPALDNAHRLGLLDLIAIDAFTARSRGFRGVARLRAALELHRPDVFTRSGLERRFLDLIRKTDLPQPSMNFFIHGCELDAYWPAERFAVELDTYDYHGSPSAFESDRLRQENLKLAGIEMTRITGTRLDREPQAVTERLRRLLTQRQMELSPSIRG